MLLLRLLLLASAAHLAVADVPPSNKVLFILSGQSNMAGRGGVVANRWDGVVPPDCAPSPAVLRLSPDLRWEQAHEPLHAGIDAANHAVGVGPGMAFANALLRSGRAGAPVVGLVPCAVGGTRMAEWGKGTQLYADMLRRARVAVETGGRIGAVLWYQGESDTVRRSDATEYGRRMGMLVRDLRADLGMPHLLVIQVGLASGLGQYTEVVREAQKGIKLRNVKFVDAKGLPLQDGHLHLSTQAQVQLGHMLAQSYLNYGHAHSRTPKPWWLQIMLVCCFIFLYEGGSTRILFLYRTGEVKKKVKGLCAHNLIPTHRHVMPLEDSFYQDLSYTFKLFPKEVIHYTRFFQVP